MVLSQISKIGLILKYAMVILFNAPFGFPDLDGKRSVPKLVTA